MSQKLFKPRHASDTSGRKRRGVYPTLFDARPSKLRKLDVESVGMLKQNLQKLNPSVPFSKMIPNVNDIVLIDTIVGEVAKGSVLHVQLKEFGTSIQPRAISGVSSSSSLESEPGNVVERREDLRHHETSVTHIISPVKEHPISLSEINNRCERVKRSLFKTEEEIVEIESQTSQQSACQEWYKHRFGRVTASKSYSPCKIAPWNSMEFHGTPWSSMELHGKFMESHGGSMELHGVPWRVHGIPWRVHRISWRFHRTSWNSMEFHGTSMELHGRP